MDRESAAPHASSTWHAPAAGCRQVVGLKQENGRLKEELKTYQQDFEDMLKAADDYELYGAADPAAAATMAGAACSTHGGFQSRPGTAGRSRPSTASGSRPASGKPSGTGAAVGPAASRLAVASPATTGAEAARPGVPEEAAAADADAQPALAERLQRCERVLTSMRRVAETERRRARQVGWHPPSTAPRG